MDKKYVIVVDGYSSGSLYVKELIKQNITAIHVKSFNTDVKFLSNTFNHELYHANFTFDDDYTKLLNEIKSYLKPENSSISALFIGTTAYNGFMLADKLCSDLNIPGNSPETSLNRVDKYSMINTLKVKGVPALNQILTDNYDEALAFKSKHNSVVIKPRLSGGSEGVFITNSDEKTLEAFNQQKNYIRNVYGSDAPEQYRGKVLLQENLSGTEYVVCSYSLNKQHKITSIWESKKREILDGETKARDYLNLINPQEFEEYESLISYCEQCLDALGVENGPCNSDIIVDKERGPLLLEINPRIPGGMSPVVFKHGLGESYIEQTIKYSLDENEFTNAPSKYKFENHAACVAIISTNQGLLMQLPLNTILELNSLKCYAIKYKLGDIVKKTTDITDIVGMVYLSTNSKDILESDIATIRNWENTYFGNSINTSAVNNSNILNAMSSLGKYKLPVIAGIVGATAVAAKCYQDYKYNSI